MRVLVDVECALMHCRFYKSFSASWDEVIEKLREFSVEHSSHGKLVFEITGSFCDQDEPVRSEKEAAMQMYWDVSCGETPPRVAAEAEEEVVAECFVCGTLVPTSLFGQHQSAH